MSEPFKLSDQQKQLLRTSMLSELPEEDCQLFFQTVERTQLDPFKRQIYATSRWNKQAQRKVLSTLTSIDGFRVIAQRSGHYAGQVGPFWCGADGKWLKDEEGRPAPWLAKEYPAASMVGVLRNGFQAPLYAIARWESYVQKTTQGVGQFWNQMPDLMIGKVAESLALRRAFPDELAGLYTPEEMAQQDNGHTEVPETPKPKKLTAATAADPEAFKQICGILESIGCRRGHREEADAVLSFCFPDWTIEFAHKTAGACDSVFEKLATLQEAGDSGEEIYRQAMLKAGLRPELAAEPETVKGAS